MGEGDFSILAGKVWEADDLKKRLLEKEKEIAQLQKQFSEKEAFLSNICNKLKEELEQERQAHEETKKKISVIRGELQNAKVKIEELERKIRLNQQEKERKKSPLSLFK